MCRIQFTWFNFNIHLKKHQDILPTYRINNIEPSPFLSFQYSMRKHQNRVWTIIYWWKFWNMILGCNYIEVELLEWPWVSSILMDLRNRPSHCNVNQSSSINWSQILLHLSSFICADIEIPSLHAVFWCESLILIVSEYQSNYVNCGFRVECGRPLHGTYGYYYRKK